VEKRAIPEIKERRRKTSYASFLFSGEEDRDGTGHIILNARGRIEREEEKKKDHA